MRRFFWIFCMIFGVGGAAGLFFRSHLFHAKNTPPLVHEAYVSITNNSAGEGALNVIHEIFDKPGSQGVVECNATSCTASTDSDVFAFLKQTFMGGLRKAPKVFAQSVNTKYINGSAFNCSIYGGCAGGRNISGTTSVAWSTATWMYELPVATDGQYALSVNVSNALSSGSIQPDINNPNIASDLKVLRFGNIVLLENGILLKNFDNTSVPATSTSHPWTIELGTLKAGKTYVIRFGWLNDSWITDPTSTCYLCDLNAKIHSLSLTNISNTIDVMRLNGSQATGTGFQNQGTVSTAATSATWKYSVEVETSGTYTFAVSSKNVGSNDITKAVTCPTGSTANDCVPVANKVHRFENIQLFDGTTVVRSFDPVTVPASPNPQGWSVPVGALLAGKKYTVQFTWSNDYTSVPNGTYNTNVEIDSVTFTRDSIRGDAASSDSSDIIGVRAYSNPEYRGLSDWYQTYAPNPGKPTTTTINGYPALIDGNTMYVMGFNLVNKADLPCWGVGNGSCPTSP